MEQVYGGIDLHSNNSVVAIVDAQGTKVFGRRLVNDLARIEQCLGKYRERLCGVVIESTLNWYWLVDGLMERGYQVHLANTTAIEQYNGLKHTDDDSDAEYLANLLRLGILPGLHLSEGGAGGARPVAQNGVAERWIGTCRRELLDHVIVLDEGHLRRLLSEFLAY